MPYRALADFLEDMAQTGDLLRVETDCDPTLEAIHATRQLLAASSGVRLWTAVGDQEFPLLENLFGTEARICRALGVQDLGEITERVMRWLQSSAGRAGWKKLLGMPAEGSLGNLVPSKVRSGSCQQIVRLGTDVDLEALPFLRCGGEEFPAVLFAAPLLTATVETRQSVSGRFDVHRLDRRRLAVAWSDCDGPAQQFAEHRQRGEKMPVAIVFGGDPAFLLASAAVLPNEADALALAGLLREKPLEVVPGRTVDLLVPAEADVVIEGYIDSQEPLPTLNSYVSLNGSCLPPRPVPVVQVTAITHRANPVLPIWLPGPSLQESVTVTRALQRMFLPVLQAAIPELVDCDFPAFGSARRWATLAIRQTYPGQARRVAHAAWALRPFRPVRWLVLVDADVDVHDTEAVLAAVTQYVHPLRDLWSEPGLPDVVDSLAQKASPGGRITMDATRKSSLP